MITAIGTAPRAPDTARVQALSEEWRARAQDLIPQDLGQVADDAPAGRDAALASFMRGILSDPTWGPVLKGIFSASPYLSDLALKHPAIVMETVQAGSGAVIARLISELSKLEDPEAAKHTLRRAKSAAALSIALSDLSGAWIVDQVTASLSEFADATVRHALRCLLARAAARKLIASPDAADPERGCGYAVLGLGKLGGRELNYSSDIDLFVFFDDQRLKYTGPKSAQEFAVQLTKDLVQLLQERTPEGYVFRTDLRLRPDPASTSIAVSRAAAQAYYENYGQNWERAAFIKARPVAGDIALASEFMRDLQPFIWRKSLDFYTIQDIHSIKRQIYAHKGGGHVQVAGHNIKLGRGGIREIEFYAQVQQLIWGGRFPEARVSQTLPALDVLVKLSVVQPNARDDLVEAYRALRTLEHRLQMIADEQTQTMPDEGAAFTTLAAFCGFADSKTFTQAVEQRLRTVESHYAALFEDAPTLAIAGESTTGNLVFTGTDDDPDTIATLTRLGYREPQTIAGTVRAWHHGRYRATRSNRARQLLTEVMPALLSAFARTAQPDAAFIRFDRSLAALPAGVPLLSVFYSNPELLDLVAEIMGDAPRLAEQVTHTPELLDYVLEPEFYAPLPEREALASDLDTTLGGADSFEALLDLVRRWTHDQQFRIGVQTLRGLIDPVVAAEHLSLVASLVVNGLVPRVADEFARQYGRIPGGSLAVLGYGKLASAELTPSSDLDLVFIYDAPEEAVSSGGEKTFPAPAYYIRLVQRIVSAFTLLTRQGALYKIDMRLRPNGDKGPLAASLESFAKYHAEDAWTWEHLALVRSRVIYAESALAEKIAGIVTQILSRPRDPANLLLAVADMRALMRKEQSAKGLWDFKRNPGGLIDAEFILQYLALRHPTAWLEKSAVQDNRPTVVIAHLVTAGVLSAADAAVLNNAIALWSRLQFMVRLTTEGDIDVAALPLGLKAKLAALAGAADEKALEVLMAETAQTVYALFDRIIADPATSARERLPRDAVIR